MQKMYSAKELSKYIINKCTIDEEYISNLQLQKILFYIQDHNNIILIKGNHEYMWQEALYYGVYYDDFDYPSRALKLWLANGYNDEKYS